MSDTRHYDTLEFPDYLDGTASTSITLWQDKPATVKSGAESAGISDAGGAPAGNEADIATQRYDALTRRLLGVGLAEAAYPGGHGRSTWRLKLADGRSVIVSKRDSQSRSILDARVLAALGAHGAPVPKLIAYNGLVLIQEDVGDVRVSEPLLGGVSEDAYAGIARSLIDSLWEVYAAADKADLVAHVPVIGRSADWIRGFIDRTALIGNNVGISCPAPDVADLVDLFQVYEPEFVKWDARPANAMARGDGQFVWIDWEHCGARHRLDDLAWILADDTMPTYPDREMAIIEDYLPRYGRGPLGRLAREYLFSFGANHAANRLARILANKADGPWAAEDIVKSTDTERVRRSEAVGLCRRAGRWSAESRTMRPLAGWFADVAASLESEAKPNRHERRKMTKTKL